MQTTKYIVNFNEQECTIELIEQSITIPLPVLLVKHDTKIIFEKYITNNLVIDFFDNYCKIDKKETIVFDKDSSSSFEIFKTNIEQLQKTKLAASYYANGNLMYIGYKLDDNVMVNHGTLYYNSHYKQIKYVGEFENNTFDGSGIFYSINGLMSITCNNITKGIPTQHGKIIYNFKDYKKTIDIEFKDIWNEFALGSDIQIKKFVVSDDFVDTVCTKFTHAKISKKSMEELVISELPDTEKIIKIYKQLDNMKNNMEHFVQILQFTIILSAFTIILVILTLYTINYIK